MNESEKVIKSVEMDIAAGLKERFPQIFEDGKVNLEKLQALLTGEIVEKEDDRFYFNWAGKNRLFKLIQEPGHGTLKPDRGRSIDFDSTENIVIAGENLETLKLLLKPYFGKVKMIYIDPPYNTGKDFIYRDNFKEPLKDYLEKTGQIDSEGSKLTTNTEASGRYHSDWLNFMYPRLFLARSLLREDGVIFVSIDDHEVHNLRKIMDEIFGEENFVANIVWQHSVQPKGYLEKFSIHHNYILCYQKSDLFTLEALERTEEHNKNYSNPDNDPNGPWRSGDVRNALYRPNLIFDIITPSGKIIKPPDNGWRWSKETIKKKIEAGEIIFNEDETRIIRKIYLKNVQGRAPETIWFGKEVGTTREAVQELKELFDGKTPFETPKPSRLVKRMLEIATEKQSDELVLDFFAGSGTTGHAVWNLNREDGGNRKFILVNLDEEVLDENIKKEFPTVADICIERLRRVSEKYRTEKQQKLIEKDHDFGFKVFKLDRSNFNLKDEFEISEDDDAEDVKKKYLEWLGLWINEPLVGGWRPIDVVYEVILKEGLDLNSKIEETKIKDNGFFHVVDEEQELEFYISLDEKIVGETIEEIRTSKYKDRMFVFLDKALTDNDKINLRAFVNLKVI